MSKRLLLVIGLSVLGTSQPAEAQAQVCRYVFSSSAQKRARLGKADLLLEEGAYKTYRVPSPKGLHAWEAELTLAVGPFLARGRGFDGNLTSLIIEDPKPNKLGIEALQWDIEKKLRGGSKVGYSTMLRLAYNVEGNLKKNRESFLQLMRKQRGYELEFSGPGGISFTNKKLGTLANLTIHQEQLTIGFIHVDPVERLETVLKDIVPHILDLAVKTAPEMKIPDEVVNAAIHAAKENNSVYVPSNYRSR